MDGQGWCLGAAGSQGGDQAWIPAEYGGRQLLQGHSNIVFSSGSFDGWSSGGVASNDSSTGEEPESAAHVAVANCLNSELCARVCRRMRDLQLTRVRRVVFVSDRRGRSPS